jgi:hypothetical protein
MFAAVGMLTGVVDGASLASRVLRAVVWAAFLSRLCVIADFCTAAATGVGTGTGATGFAVPKEPNDALGGEVDDGDDFAGELIEADLDDPPDEPEEKPEEKLDPPPLVNPNTGSVNSATRKTVLSSFIDSFPFRLRLDAAADAKLTRCAENR